MKKFIFAAILISPLALFAQTEGDYPHQLTDVAVRLDGGNVVASGGSSTITGGTCTNQVATAVDTSGVPTCADITSAMIPAAAIQTSDIADGNALSIFGRAANSSGVMASIAAGAASDCVFRESGSALACGTVTTAGIADGAVTLAKIAVAASNRILLGSGTAGSGAAYTEIASGSNATVYADDTAAQHVGFDPRTQWFLYDDFGFAIATTTNPGGFVAWTVTATNTPGNFASVADSTGNHPGEFSFNGNAGNNAIHILRTGTSAHSIIGGEVVECMVNFALVNFGKFYCGFGDSLSDPTASTDGLGMFITAADAHVQTRNVAAGVSTGGILASNTLLTTSTWYRLTVKVNAAATSVSYYVNGTELNNSPVTTNIPTGANVFGIECGVVQSAGGAAALATVDYIMAYGTISR